MGKEQDLKEKIQQEIEGKGYYLNPDDDFTLPLLESLLVNEERYGYMFCPCRLATRNKEADLDLICPCDYRDEDVEEYGACYCGLYVNEEISRGKRPAKPIPERRKTKKPGGDNSPGKDGSPGSCSPLGSIPYPIFRCKVCGYLCARNQPPGRCPICGVTKERFEAFGNGG